MRAQLHYLELVYPPISNQEAEWLKDDEDVKNAINDSNIYFIGQRPEGFFTFNEDVEQKLRDEYRIYFGFTTGGVIDDGYIDLNQLLEARKIPDEVTFDIELGGKLIRIWVFKNDNEKEILAWFTTEKVLFDKSRGVSHVKKLENYKEFLKYHLHYVGISKKEDSLRRLVVKPHDKRLRILSNEFPFTRASRLTDEMVLFFFRIKSMEVKQYLKSEDFDEIGFSELHNYERIVADAEKAFVQIMDTKYNEVKFKDYPYSIDGLFPTTVERYTFSIDEDIQFITTAATIKGVRRRMPSFEEGDWIGVSKDLVELVKIDEIKD